MRTAWEGSLWQRVVELDVNKKDSDDWMHCSFSSESLQRGELCRLGPQKHYVYGDKASSSGVRIRHMQNIKGLGSGLMNRFKEISIHWLT